MVEVAAKKYGVKETKEMLVFAFKLGGVIKEAHDNDGKYSYADLIFLPKLAPSFVSAADHADAIGKEIQDIDGEELNELALTVGAEIGVLGKEKLIAQVMAGLEVVKSLHAFVKLL